MPTQRVVKDGPKRAWPARALELVETSLAEARATLELAQDAHKRRAEELAGAQTRLERARGDVAVLEDLVELAKEMGLS